MKERFEATNQINDEITLIVDESFDEEDDLQFLMHDDDQDYGGNNSVFITRTDVKRLVEHLEKLLNE